MSALERGTIVAGRYRLERPLAQGGMGCVWVARHLQLDVDVAIKFMAPQLAASAEARVRFEREARASAQLKLANAVQVHDYGVDDGVPFLVMELLEGEDLERRLQREGRLSLAATLAVLDPACRALRVAHEAGLVHRDLKPGNIFLARQGSEEVVKILDFGIAKDTGSAFGGAATRSGSMLGSPLYMSPEQVRSSNKVDHRSDLWSLGVIAFRCLTGQLPFYSDEVGEVLIDVCTAPVPRPSQVAGDLGLDVDAFFDRALSRALDQRFQSASAFISALASLSVSTGPQAVPHPGRAEPGPVSMAGVAASTRPASTGGQGAGAPPPHATMGTFSPSVYTQANAAPRWRTGVVVAAIGATVLGGVVAFVGVTRVQAPAAAPPPSSAFLPPSAVPSSPPPDPAASAAPAPTGAPSASAAATADPAPTGTAAPAKKNPAKPGPGPARPRRGDDLLNHI